MANEYLSTFSSMSDSSITDKLRETFVWFPIYAFSDHIIHWYAFFTLFYLIRSIYLSVSTHFFFINLIFFFFSQNESIGKTHRDIADLVCFLSTCIVKMLIFFLFLCKQLLDEQKVEFKKGHRLPVTAVAISLDGKFGFSASKDGYIKKCNSFISTL